MKKLIACFLLVFGLTAAAASAGPLPANVQTITPQEIASKIETTHQPFILFVYASWCPYCKKQIKEMNAALTGVDPITLPPIIGVSIDSNPDAYSAFLTHQGKMPWDSRLYMGEASLEAILSKYGSSFDGPIPYLAVIKDQEVVKEFSGLTDPADLRF